MRSFLIGAAFASLAIPAYAGMSCVNAVCTEDVKQITWSAPQTFSQPPIFTTLTGYLKGNGSSAITAISTIPSADFADGNTGTGAVAHATGAIINPSRLKLTDQGQCTMTAGACSAQALGSTYTTAPICVLTWTGTGSLAGVLKVASTTTTVTPTSSNGADTAQVNYACFGN